MDRAATHLGFGTWEELATGQATKRRTRREGSRRLRAAFLDSAMRDFVGIAISGNGRNEMKAVATCTPAGDNPERESRIVALPR
jgi:hypothetical protein